MSGELLGRQPFELLEDVALHEPLEGFRLVVREAQPEERQGREALPAGLHAGDARDADGDGQVDIEDNLPVLAYSQDKSRYWGAEFNFDTDLNKYFNLFFNADYVRAELTDLNLNLPRIPPAHAKFGVNYKIKGFNLRPEVELASAQTKLFPLERRTAGYGIFNVAANYTIGKAHLAHIFSVNAYNLSNKEYRNHLSFIKELAPEVGRGVKFSYTIRFF